MKVVKGMGVAALTALLLSFAGAVRANDCVVLGSRGGTSGASGALAARFEAVVRDYPSLHAAIEAEAPRLCLVDGVREAAGEYAPLENEVRIASSLPEGLMLSILLHEARHVEQLSRGFCPSNALSMRENARMVFALEADASAVSLLVAWSLREAGQPDAWQALSEWEMQQDIADAFEAEMRASGDPGLAAARAFDQWYGSAERREAYYLASCSDYLARQEESHALPRYGMLPDDFLKSLCNLPDGTRYGCEDPEDPFGR